LGVCGILLGEREAHRIGFLESLELPEELAHARDVIAKAGQFRWIVPN
jgi:hypothetical protein